MDYFLKSKNKPEPEKKGEPSAAKNKPLENIKPKSKQKLSKMRFGMLVYIGYRNLRSSKLRSFLTIGGVAIGIGIITILICLGFGGKCGRFLAQQ